MADLFDDISRLVASRMPRRQALKHIVRLVAGGGLTLLVPARLYSAPAHCIDDRDCLAYEFCCRSKGQCYVPANVYGCCERAANGIRVCASRTDQATCLFCEGGTFYVGDNYTCDNARCTPRRFNPSPIRPS